MVGNSGGTIYMYVYMYICIGQILTSFIAPLLVQAAEAASQPAARATGTARSESFLKLSRVSKPELLAVFWSPPKS